VIYAELDMINTIKENLVAKVVLILFILLSFWWISLRFMNLPQDSNANQLFAGVYGLIALIGGIWGLTISRKWGGVRSVMGRSIFFFALGLLSQEVGQIIYSSYIYFLHIPVPYPSIGDLFFYGTIPLYVIAIFYLGQASGIHISLRSFRNKLQAILIPTAILVLSYIVFLQGYKADWSNSLKVFLDFAVPFGQAIYISLAILTYTLTRGILGGMMKSRVSFILFALSAQYIADWTFLYQANRGTWYAGGLNDYMYLCSYFLMTLGLLQLGTTHEKLKK
jgi:hypothetical protein